MREELVSQLPKGYLKQMASGVNRSGWAAWYSSQQDRNVAPCAAAASRVYWLRLVETTTAETLRARAIVVSSLSASGFYHPLLWYYNTIYCIRSQVLALDVQRLSSIYTHSMRIYTHSMRILLCTYNTCIYTHTSSCINIKKERAFALSLLFVFVLIL